MNFIYLIESDKMAIYKITYSKGFKRANVHNYGCNFNCAWCSYKLQEKHKPDRFLNISEIKEALGKLDTDKVHFGGGELTTYPLFHEICDFTKNELGVYSKIGHSNGFNLPPETIDAISVSIKSLSEDVHLQYTGKSNVPVLRNFKTIYERGIEVDASSVFIPGLIEYREIEEISKFIANIDPEIPYHIVGYVPVPNVPWRSPTKEEIFKAKQVAEQYLDDITISWFHSPEDYIKMTKEDYNYQSVRVA